MAINNSATNNMSFYQIDWSHEQAGKRVAAAKRKIRFRFGFANEAALAQGLKGPECRGSEHELLLVWSLTSGKKQVLVDGNEVHYSKGKMGENRFESSFVIAGHVGKIVAHAAPPLQTIPGFRQFDMHVDGMSFFEMPKIYELGMSNKRSVKSRPVPIQTEERHFAMAPTTVEPVSFQSPTYERRTVQPVAITPEYVPPPTPSVAPSTSHHNAMVTPSSLSVYQSPPNWEAAPPVQDEFAPVMPPPPTYQDKSNQILSAYEPDPKIPQLTYSPHYAEYDSASPSATMTDVSEDGSEATPEKDFSPVTLKPTMAPISIAEMEEKEPVDTDDIQRAFKSLVNLDDLTRELETPEQAKTARLLKEKKERATDKSRPLPPTKPDWSIGSNASLSNIKEKAPAKDVPKKEIMKTHAFDPNAAQAGMMVVYGATQGPPPPQVGYGHAMNGYGHAAQPAFGMAALPPPPAYYHRAY